jgi:four helix bundle protein
VGSAAVSLKEEHKNKMDRLAQSFRDLEIYKQAFQFQQEIFGVTRLWPVEERFALTDQIRRSSRSIGANIAEAWSKRRYPAHFLSKLTDSDGELQETRHWLDTASACGYTVDAEHRDFIARAEAIGKMLGSMLQKYDSFCTAH